MSFIVNEENHDEFKMWQGLQGPYYTPYVSENGIISWTNNGGLQNPPDVNIKGDPGAGLEISGTADTVGDLPETAEEYSVYLVGTSEPYYGYIYADGEWKNIGEIGKGETGEGVPTGGTAGQSLKKQSNTDYDTAWETEDLGISGASVGDLVRISAVSYGKPTAFEKISDPNGNIGIVQNGNTATKNISKGQYVIWHGALYTASAAIASGAALSSSNLTAVTGGGLNNVGEKVSALRNDTALIITTRRWNFSPFVDQVVSLEGGLYLMTIDSRNMGNGNYTGVYIVEINTGFNSHITTLKDPVTPIANASVNKGTLTITPVYDHGFASIVKLTN